MYICSLKTLSCFSILTWERRKFTWDEMKEEAHVSAWALLCLSQTLRRVPGSKVETCALSFSSHAVTHLHHLFIYLLGFAVTRPHGKALLGTKTGAYELC
jgi:hypothetical protein